MKSIQINKNDTWVIIPIISERPFLYLSHIEINGLNGKSLQFSGASLTFFESNKSSQTIPLNSEPQESKLIFDQDFHINKSLDRIEFKLGLSLGLIEGDLDATLFFENEYFQKDEDSDSSFLEHITKPSNSKIFFSAPYGQGKSTFLKYFFESNTKQYETFFLYPVNYPVSTNEDIFRYIKTDILFQLFGKNVEFSKEEVTNELATYNYLLSEPKEVLAGLLKIALSIAIPGVNMSEVISQLDKIFDGIKNSKSDLGVDDKKTAEEYLKVVYEKEGTIYEDNFYTQLIRELVDQINEKTSKKTVLIIEDLDRMDPDHIFRILNVISAHYDASCQIDENYSNKFGFDKIIIVGNIKNIKELYKHRFGINVEFEGYINKFYSSNIFHFQYNKAIKSILDDFTIKHLPKEVMHAILILRFFLVSKIISLRNLNKVELKLIHLGGYDSARRAFIKNSKENSDYFIKGMFSLMLHLVAELFDDKNDLEKKLKILNQQSFEYKSENEWEMDYLGSYLLSSLITKDMKLTGSQYSLNIESSTFSFGINPNNAHPYNTFIANSIKINNEEINNFITAQIIDLVIANLNKLS